ncbi:phosphonate metabolism transcriptional regulator PhnF [Chelativorans sp. AA-79]|uniref:phosphonate metabolism transcriptional regulator PhnF n=1 Tax=Chelativorans sp. AA-79 TaxID=3028735 RepID=UPI0023F80F87|nr:phosphonate metabolism transcriptional regulator PhnF [Chelativorans sp. AA-79]WEX09459.1 phosphonate metabolism transcriptional regulator PhnF [Chelativorans sp. AA-79]
MSGEAGIERRSGVALWRQIADQIRQGIATELGDQNGRLPTEIALAERFGVNRHTVRTAIQALVQEGVLRAEQGRGTFIERQPRLSYPIGPRTRFSAGLEGQARERRGNLLDHAYEEAPAAVAEALELAPGARVLRLETLAEADGRPISRARSYFDAKRFAGFERHFARTGSITMAYRHFNVSDYLRRSTAISARHADSVDLEVLKLAPGAIVLVAIGLNVDRSGKPIQFSETRFSADRVELQVGGQMP